MNHPAYVFAIRTDPTGRVTDQARFSDLPTDLTNREKLFFTASVARALGLDDLDRTIRALEYEDPYRPTA